MSRFSVVVYGFLLALFSLLSYSAYRFANLPGDVAISAWLQGIELPLVKAVLQAISYLGATVPAAITVVSIVGGLLLYRRKLEAIFVASLTSSAALLNWLLKLLIDRTRPGDDLSGLSFPSGHTTYAVVLYGFLFFLVPKLTGQPVLIVVPMEIEFAGS